jgi:hypothetical protein
MQVAELEEAAAAAHTATPRRAQYDADCKLQLAQQLLAERQAQWEATASARAARILALERQLEEVRCPYCLPMFLLFMRTSNREIKIGRTVESEFSCYRSTRMPQSCKLSCMLSLVDVISKMRIWSCFSLCRLGQTTALPLRKGLLLARFCCSEVKIVLSLYVSVEFQ